MRGRLRRVQVQAGPWRVHVRLAVDRAPAGRPAVVLVHGLGVSSRYMVPLARALAPDFPVFAPDLPGFGWSEKPRRVLDIPELADALVAVLDALGLERPALIGNSMGCQVIVDLAARYPQRIDRAVLNGPTVDRHARTPLRQLLRLLAASPREPLSQSLVVAADYLQCGPRRLLRTFRHALADPIERKLPFVRVPALVLRGARDLLVPQQWAEEVTRLLPMGRLVVLPGVAHAVNYSAPEAFARVARSFLEEAASAARAEGATSRAR